MSRHNHLVRLRHMLDHAREAVSLLKGRAKTQLKQTRLSWSPLDVGGQCVPLTPFHEPVMYFLGGAMKKSRAHFECAILVDGRTVRKGKRPARVYPRIRARHPQAKISIRWTPPSHVYL